MWYLAHIKTPNGEYEVVVFGKTIVQAIKQIQDQYGTYSSCDMKLIGDKNFLKKDLTTPKNYGTICM